MRFKITLLFSFLLIRFIHSQPYVWPTDASWLMSSSFCEYRPAHFHAGIDIKTWAQEGYLVFAIAPGYIKRILVSPYGYGKALYLQLNNGWTVVYGHLSEFETLLENYAEQQQRSKGQYELDLHLGPQDFPVNAGDLIAYTGQTGIGVPHLHFEVRDAENQPFNPLQLGYRIQDTKPPVIQSIAIAPLEYGSHVNGDFIDQIIDPSEYDLYSAPIPVWGKIGLMVSVYDQADGASNRFTPLSLRLFVNDSLAFQKTFQAFSYSETRLIDLDRNLRLRKKYGQEFHNLFVMPGNTLPFYSPSVPSAGVLMCGYRILRRTDEYDSESLGRLLSGRILIRIEAEDYWGNISTSRFQLEVKHFSELVRVYQKDAPVKSFEMVKPILKKNWMYDYIRFAFRTQDIESAFPRVLVWLNGELINTLPMVLNDSGDFISILPLDASFRGEMICQVKVANQFSAVWQDTTWIYFINQNGGAIRSRDRRFQCTIPPDALCGPTWFHVDTVCDSANTYPIYSVVPNDIYMKGPVHIQIALYSDQSYQSAGIYTYDGKLRYLKSNVSHGYKVLNAHTVFLNKFTVLHDTMPPVLLSMFPDSGQMLSRDIYNVHFTFVDSLSDISGEENYQIRIDGMPQIVAYDPENNRGRVDPLDPLNTGRHWLDVFIRDKAGNETRRGYPFYLTQ